MISYARSEALLAKASKLIPLGAQTFSKTKIHFPGAAPRFLSHAEGALVWDVDGNAYVDLVGSLGCSVLGYCDPHVNAAIIAQLQNGISFSLATELEYQLAERLHRLFPSAEMVRFGKSGTDATTAAVRLARFFTGRMKVMHTGYHGWGEWSICSTNPEGVPRVNQSLTQRMPFNDLQTVADQLRAYPDEWAAFVIDASEMLPVGSTYLQELQELLGKYGVLLIFDEVLSAFRYHLGGAQSLYKVTPDLCCLGKAMGNGMPISAICGRKDIMSTINQPGPFYSGTFFGETLSIAAAIATIDKLEREDGITKLRAIGNKLRDVFPSRGDIFATGHPSLLRLKFRTPEIKQQFQEKMLSNGVLVNNMIVPSLCHGQSEIKRVAMAVEASI